MNRPAAAARGRQPARLGLCALLLGSALCAACQGDGTDTEPCDLTPCDSHAHCESIDGTATCVCDDGYAEVDGLGCVDRQYVPCVDETPPDARASEHQAEITYSTEAGWSTPAACAWVCDSGLLRVLDACVELSALERWCSGHCATVLTCPEVIGPDPSGCPEACLAQLDVPARAASLICHAIHERLEAVTCADVANCAEPVSESSCDEMCSDLGACGPFDAVGLPFGSSHGECRLNCDAVATTLIDHPTLPLVLSCLLDAAQACDPLHLLGCADYLYVDACDWICAANAVACDFIPGLWPDEAACRATCKAWTPGQRIRVGTCLNGVPTAPCDAAVAQRCVEPATALPEGVTDFILAMDALCPDFLEVSTEPAYVVEYFGWKILGITSQLRAEPVDFVAAAACVNAREDCPDSGPIAIGCLLAVPVYPPAVEACATAVPCLAAAGSPIDQWGCEQSVSIDHASDPEGMDAILTCVGAATTCPDVLACLPPEP